MNPALATDLSVTAYVHPDIWLHDAEADHVAMESARLKTFSEALQNSSSIKICRPDEATLEQLSRVHSPEYLAYLRSSATLPQGDVLRIDSETVLNRHTWRMLLLSAGAVCQAIDSVAAGSRKNSVCVGYAGHHGEPSRAGGFCFTNPVAIGARHAQAIGYKRIAVLDFDTHSGNGTILAVRDDPQVLFAETYQPGYPGLFLQSGVPSNVLRTKCKTGRDWHYAWERLLDKVKAFEPELILVSAGFDAHALDPLCALSNGLRLSDYTHLGIELNRLNVPVVATLEGGYNVEVAAQCLKTFTACLIR